MPGEGDDVLTADLDREVDAFPELGLDEIVVRRIEWPLGKAMSGLGIPDALAIRPNASRDSARGGGRRASVWTNKRRDAVGTP
jgi:hypothetical protein